MVKKIGKKVKVISAEISLVKTFRPDILIEADGEIIQVEIQAQQDKTLPKRMFQYYYAIIEKCFVAMIFYNGEKYKNPYLKK